MKLTFMDIEKLALPCNPCMHRLELVMPREYLEFRFSKRELQISKYTTIPGCEFYMTIDF